MDESVKAAMARWPDVPGVDGFLRLDADGRWHIPDGRVSHPSFVEFINRNYEHDRDSGRWYFQNGPQRVWATPDATAVIVTAAAIVNGVVAATTHHGLTCEIMPDALCLDSAGSLFGTTPWGRSRFSTAAVQTISAHLVESGSGFVLVTGQRHVPIRMCARDSGG